MSYNTDLQTNNVNLQAILDTVNNLPEAGGGGGSSGTALKTCTLDGLNWSTVYYTTIENDTIVYKTVEFGKSSEPITVLCDSIIYYVADGELDPGTYVVLTGGFEQLHYSQLRYIVIKASSTANASGTFNMMISDPW